MECLNNNEGSADESERGNCYEAMQSGQPGELSTGELPPKKGVSPILDARWDLLETIYHDTYGGSFQPGSSSW